MTVGEMLELKAMHKLKLVAGQQGLDRKIQGVNVLEATDISNWGRSGEVILTGYFALQHLNDEELEKFFEKMVNIGISAVIIKIDRLLSYIPVKIIELCDKLVIPLIQIGGDIKYETIILEILGPIVNHNISLLNRYYEVHGELTKLALKRPTMEELLSEFKKMLQRDVSFINRTKGWEITTNEQLKGTILIASEEILPGKYINFKYERRKIIYNNLPNKIQGTQIIVSIPYLGYDEYALLIHELLEPLDSEDFMVLENSVKFLQMELLKKFVVSQNIAQQKNNIISDLLNNKVYEERAVDEILDSLGINKYKHYKIFIIKLHKKETAKNISSNYLADAIYKIKIGIKNGFNDVVFIEKTDRIIFMQNFAQSNRAINDEDVKKMLGRLQDTGVWENLYYNVSISATGTKEDITSLHQEAIKTQNILRFFYNTNKILGYEELGIYKLFLDVNSVGELKKFVDPKIARFRDAFPLLFETLAVFLDARQNYNLTAEKLFLHPKTVRYRIDKIKTILNIDIDNPEELLQIQIADRLFKLMDGGRIG